MKKRTVFVMAMLLLLGAAVPAQADNVPSHPELKKFQEEGGSVAFLGHMYGLDGWVLSKADAEPRTVYTNSDGAMVMGILMNKDGTVETQNQLLALRDRIDGSQAAMPGAEKNIGSKAERAYALLEKAKWTKVGADDAPYIYILMNVACDHCQAYFKDLQPAIKANKVQVRLIPFGAKEFNRDSGAALLSVADAGEAWMKFIDGDKSVLSKDKAKVDMYGAIDANTKLVGELKFKGMPPFTMYRKRGDGQIVAIIGRPKNLMLLQADLIK